MAFSNANIGDRTPDNERADKLNPIVPQDGLEAQKLLKDGTERLQTSTKTSDASGGIVAMAMIVAALFVWRQERAESRKKRFETVPDVGGFDARTRENPEADLKTAEVRIKEIDAEFKTNEDEEADLKAIADPTLADGPVQRKLKTQNQTRITELRTARTELTKQRAEQQERIARIKVEMSRRMGMVQDLQKRLGSSTIATSATLENGHQLRIALRNPLSKADRDTLEKTLGALRTGMGTTSLDGTTITLALPPEFFAPRSPVTAGSLGAAGLNARQNIFAWLAGTNPEEIAKNEKQEVDTKNSDMDAKTKVAEDPLMKERKEKAAKPLKQKMENEAKEQEEEKKKAYSSEEFLKKQSEDLAAVIEAAASGGSADARLIVRLDDAYALCEKATAQAQKNYWDASGRANTLGWADVAADREAITAPALHPTQVAEYQEKARAAKKAYQDAQAETKRLNGRYERVAAFKTALYAERQRRDKIAGFSNGGGDGNVSIDFPQSNPFVVLAARELLGITVPFSSGNLRQQILFPAAAWRDNPDASGPTVAMIFKINRGTALNAPEQSALEQLAPLAAAVRRFNLNTQTAEFTFAQDGKPALRIRMATNHPQYADVSKRFADAVLPILHYDFPVGSTYVFPDTLLDPPMLSRLSEAIDANRREVSAEQADREAIRVFADSISLGRSRLGYSGVHTGRFTNAIMVEKIIEAFEERTPENDGFMSYNFMYCDDHGNLRRYARPPREGEMLIANWATLLRASPATGIALFAAIQWHPAGIGNSFQPEPLRQKLEALRSTTVVRRVSNQRQEYNRRSGEIAVADVYSSVENRLVRRVQMFQAMLAQRDTLTLGERISESFLFGSIGTVYDLAYAAGLQLPGDIRPSSAVRDVRKRTQDALKANTALLNELQNQMQFTGTPTEQTTRITDIVGRMADVSFTDIQRRLEWCRTTCNVAERGLEYADMAAAAFADRVPIAGPLLYSTLRNGVGMLAGEQIRNSDGTYRPRDFGDMGVDIAVSLVPGDRIARMIPGVRYLERMGLRFLLRTGGRYLTRMARRHAMEAILNEVKDRIKGQLQLIAKLSREGKSWEEIWDVVAAQEPDYVGFFMHTALRLFSAGTGDLVEKHIGSFLSRGTQLVRSDLVGLVARFSKPISQRAGDVTEKVLVQGTDRLVKTISEYEADQPE